MSRKVSHEKRGTYEGDELDSITLIHGVRFEETSRSSFVAYMRASLRVTKTAKCDQRPWMTMYVADILIGTGAWQC